MAIQTIVEQRAIAKRAKAEAKAAGSKTYLTGIACKRGHLSPRWVSGGGCVLCMAEFVRSEKGQSWLSAYWKTEKEKTRRKIYRSREDRIDYERKRNTCENRRASLRNARYLRKYGVPYSEVNRLCLAQNNRCLICSKDFSQKSHKLDSMVVDHCHTTGVVRGILCTGCNVGLGYFKENVVFLGNAIAYLNR